MPLMSRLLATVLATALPLSAAAQETLYFSAIPDEDETRLVERFTAVADYPGFKVVEHDLNVFDTAPDMLRLIEERQFYSLARLPLAMGLLTGKYSRGARLSGTDVRASSAPWISFLYTAS